MPGLVLSVEAAWGADLTADPASWSWTDITTDVRQDGGEQIFIRLGRGDEASTAQPANCKLRLKNASGDYSQGGQSRRWPNVRQGTPIRVRVDPGTGFTNMFVGYATGFTPSWSTGGHDAYVTLTAAGMLRRLQQGISPPRSALFRGMTAGDIRRPVAYWSCEDGADAVSFASGIAGVTAMAITGDVTPAAHSADATDPLPEFGIGTATGNIPAYTESDHLRGVVFASTPASVAAKAVIFELRTTGTTVLWQLRLSTNPGRLNMRAFDRDGVAVVDVDVDFGQSLFGVQGLFWIYLRKTSADTFWQMGFAEQLLEEVSALQYDTTLASHTFGTATIVQAGGSEDFGGGAIGHVAVFDTDEIWSLVDFARGWRGESATDRIARLCSEDGVPYEIVGDSTSTMGPQATSPVVDLLRECEAVDQGTLYDGLSEGLTYISREQRENTSAALTIDSTAGELKPPFRPVDDDQRRRNRWAVRRVGGSEAVYEDEDGPMGSHVVGLYDDSRSIAVEHDADLLDQAAWLVHLGTVEGYRYPDVALNLAKSAHLIAPWLATRLSGRIDIINIDSALTQHPSGVIALLLEGATIGLDQTRWDVTATCSLESPWHIIVLAQDSGDTGEYLCHLDTNGSELAAHADAGAVALSVHITDGPLWTTDADDFPFVITVGGVPVTVTAISGGASPQTFTVDPTSRALIAGQPVAVFDPPVPGL